MPGTVSLGIQAVALPNSGPSDQVSARPGACRAGGVVSMSPGFGLIDR